MNKTLVGNLLKAPAILILIASFIASIYAAAKQIQGINWVTPVLLGIILVLYFWGSWLHMNKN